MTANRFFFRLSGFVLLLLLIVGAAYLAIASAIHDDYVAEVNQQLYGGIASHTVAEVTPLVDGEVDTTQIQDIMHSMMVINPSVEVYLLDPGGKIITYVAPYKRVQLDRVELAPVREFIAAEATGERLFVKGDDPRHPERRNIFSAAEMRSPAEELEGYVYIILSGEEQQSVASQLQRSYVARMGGSLFLLSLLTACVIGLVGLRYLTRHLRRLVGTIERFREGDYAARVPIEGGSEFATVATTFNAMAARITSHIEEIQSVDRLRRELIANISHDLRTPLANLRGYAETLLLKPAMDEERRHRYLHTILRGAERMGHLIAQLFEYSKIEARQVEVRREAFHVGELAHDLAQRFALQAEERQIDIALDIPHDLPLIYADLGLVERVLNNLIENALKFTPPGGRVSLRMRATEESVKIAVANTGPGIPAQDIPFVFDRYRRATSDERAGAGLGLAIVKKILELHGEAITLRSQQQQGTTFAFDMPLA